MTAWAIAIIVGLAECAAVALFLTMILTWAAIGSGA